MRARDFLIMFAVIIGVVVIAGFVFPLFPTTAKRGVRTKNLSSAKQLATAARLYAFDHEDTFPAHLSQLIPDYLPAKSASDYLCRLDENGGYRESQPQFDWLYFAASCKEYELPHIIIASPQAVTEGKKNKRIVIYADGSGAVIPEERYQEELRKMVEDLQKAPVHNSPLAPEPAKQAVP